MSGKHKPAAADLPRIYEAVHHGYQKSVFAFSAPGRTLFRLPARFLLSAGLPAAAASLSAVLYYA